MYFSNFHGGTASTQPRDDRLWLLIMLRNGLNSAEDVSMCGKRHVLQLLLSFYDSPLSDPPARRICLALLQRAATIEVAAAQMLGNLGVPSWICGHAAHESVLELDEMVTLLLRLVRSPAAASVPDRGLDQCALAVVALHEALERARPPAIVTMPPVAGSFPPASTPAADSEPPNRDPNRDPSKGESASTGPRTSGSRSGMRGLAEVVLVLAGPRQAIGWAPFTPKLLVGMLQKTTPSAHAHLDTHGGGSPPLGAHERGVGPHDLSMIHALAGWQISEREIARGGVDELVDLLEVALEVTSAPVEQSAHYTDHTSQPGTM